MHMSDALLSPGVGGGFWVVSASAVVLAARRVRNRPEEHPVALSGVMAAFVFSAQMLNFTIPGTGSSGHLGGGMLLALALGPSAGLLAIASILITQALFFADGGILALGANIFNMGVIPAVATIFLRSIPAASRSPFRLAIAGGVAAWAAVVAGAVMVAAEATLSGLTELPFAFFAAIMTSIHAVIGLVEGTVTGIVLFHVARRRADVFAAATAPRSLARPAFADGLVVVFAALALLLAGAFSHYASASPDGLEWSMGKFKWNEGARTADAVHEAMAGIQERLAILPNYTFSSGESVGSGWDPGVSVSGILGGLITFLLVAGGVSAMTRMKPPTSSD